MTCTLKGIVIGLVLGISLSIGTVGYQLHDTNSELESQIAQRDNLIKRMQTSDSLSCQYSGRYDSTVTKYVSNDCSLLVDGKEVSLERFIGIYADQQQDRLELQKQLEEISRMVDAVEKRLQKREFEYSVAQDSLELYKIMVRSAKNNYGLQFKIRENNKYQTIEPEAAQLDSALVLLRVFRRQLSYDSASRQWIIKRETIRLPATKVK